MAGSKKGEAASLFARIGPAGQEGVETGTPPTVNTLATFNLLVTDLAHVVDEDPGHDLVVFVDSHTASLVEPRDRLVAGARRVLVVGEAPDSWASAENVGTYQSVAGISRE